MTTRRATRLVHEGEYVVEVELMITDVEWSPNLLQDDAYKLDDARQALRDGDLKKAANLGRLFKLTPVSA